MHFASIGFGLFLVVLLIAYYTVFRRFQWQTLLVGSFVFYAFSGWSNLVYISVTIVTTWFATRRIAHIRERQRRYMADSPGLSRDEKRAYKAAVGKKLKACFLMCLLFNLAILAAAKYLRYAIDSPGAALSIFGGNRLAVTDILLPLGISFYTFKSLGYLIDVYRGKEHEPNIFRFALFVSFFPELIQGPISRFGDMRKTLFSRHSFDSPRFQAGMARMLWGFFKKTVVADRLFPAMYALVATPDEHTGIYVVFTMLFYAVTLYSDFTGGMDIAIGIAKMLGVDVKENFNRPFYSKSVAEYWRRWHITMGTWFKDYLFYPLSASQPMLKLHKLSRRVFGDGFGKRFPIYVSMMILWFATGVWHGFRMHFVVWGLLNGVVMAVSEELNPLYARFHKCLPIGDTRVYRGFMMVRTFCLTCLMRTLDVYANTRLTFRMYATIVTDFNWSGFVGKWFDGLAASDCVVVVASVAVMVVAGCVRHNRRIEYEGMRPAARHLVIGALLLSVVVFGVYGPGYDVRQFVYNQF